MKYSTLLRRSLVFYWRTNLGVLLGVSVATAVLVGALVLGDSVQYTLRRLALSRLGGVSLVLGPQNRSFPEQLADSLSTKLDASVAPVMLLPGTASSQGGTPRASDGQIIAADERFWSLGGRADPLNGQTDGVALNFRLAGKLGAGVGEEILLRFAKPGDLPREAPLSVIGEASAVIRVRVLAIVSQEEFGDFALTANQTPPYNAFVSLRALQQRAGLQDRANTLLVGTGSKIDDAASGLRQSWTLSDVGMELCELEEQEMIELRSRRVFLDAPIEAAASAWAGESLGILTYFVNELRAGGKSTPYSMVAAIGPLGGGRTFPAPLPPDMSDNEIVINQWAAEDLDVVVGDEIELVYFVLGPGRRLMERTARFTVRRIVPISGPAADRELTPQFPGLSEVRNCRDWDPGIPIDLKRIREKDEQYWSRYGATPKGFITLEAGREMWANRFGALTGVRYRRSDGPPERIASQILGDLDPGSVGLSFSPVRELALAAASEGMDFAQLFLGLSSFLIVSGLLLSGLVLSLAGDQRRGEVGMLLALGLPPRAVRRVLLFEGAILALFGAGIGAAGGLGYTRALIAGLRTLWSGAVASTTLYYHPDVSSLVLGGTGASLMGLLVMWAVLRKQSAATARELLGFQVGGPPASSDGVVRQRVALGIAVVALLTAAAMVALAYRGSPRFAVGAFFAAGSLLLLAGVAVCYYILGVAGSQRFPGRMSFGGLVIRNVARRRVRSLAVAGLLGCGCFLVVAVGSNRQDPRMAVWQRSSGTGGFALVGRSDLPIYEDLNAPSVRKALRLDREVSSGTAILPLRVLEGDDASCLNLNRAQRPRLIGVSPRELLTPRAFTFVKTIAPPAEGSGWSLLQEDFGPDVVPCVGDEATVVWGLGKKVGDTLRYTDERGNRFDARIVAVLANSIFQGALLISQEDFTKRFPSVAGYREFLIDAPPARTDSVSSALERSLADFGFELEPTAERLGRFLTVQNTYIAIFQVLGGLGMLLGVAGVAIVVFRNVVERRGELGLMRAVGFTKTKLKLLTFLEHCGLLVLGITFGTIAAIIAVLPTLRTSGTDVPTFALGATLLSVGVFGTIWVYVATVIALRGSMLAGIRDE
jgi:ABC-type antimicrobial peptide transport system permease subunit